MRLTFNFEMQPTVYFSTAAKLSPHGGSLPSRKTEARHLTSIRYLMSESFVYFDQKFGMPYPYQCTSSRQRGRDD